MGERGTPRVFRETRDPTTADHNAKPGDLWANLTDKKVFVMESTKGLVGTWSQIDVADNLIRTATVEISNAELQALAAAPKTLVAAPGAGKYIEFLGATIATIFVTTAIDSATSDGNLVIQTGTTGTDVSLTVEAAGLVDAAATAVSTAKPLATDVVMDANETIELLNDGAEFTVVGSGDSTMRVDVLYRILDLS